MPNWRGIDIAPTLRNKWINKQTYTLIKLDTCATVVPLLTTAQSMQGDERTIGIISAITKGLVIPRLPRWFVLALLPIVTLFLNNFLNRLHRISAPCGLDHVKSESTPFTIPFVTLCEKGSASRQWEHRVTSLPIQRCCSQLAPNFVLHFNIGKLL